MSTERNKSAALCQRLKELNKVHTTLIRVREQENNVYGKE